MQEASTQPGLKPSSTPSSPGASEDLLLRYVPKPSHRAGDFAGLVRYLAGDVLAPLVLNLFPGTQAATYALTRPERRHAWHAYLTAHDLEVIAPTPIEAGELRRHLLEWSSRRLLVEAYGSCPQGLERLLRRLPETALSPSGYDNLAVLCRRAEAAGVHLGQLGPLDDDKLAVLHELPVGLWNAKLLRVLDAPAAARLLRDAHLSLTRAGIDERDVIAAVLRPETWSQRAKALRALYERLTPPAVPIPSAGRCRPLTDANEMREVAQRFSNCLAGCIPAFLRGERAYAIWSGDHGEVLIELCNDAPLGWRVGEMKGPKNAAPAVEDRRAIVEQFAAWGMVEQPLFEAVIRGLFRFGRRRQRGGDAHLNALPAP